MNRLVPLLLPALLAMPVAAQSPSLVQSQVAKVTPGAKDADTNLLASALVCTSNTGQNSTFLAEVILADTPTALMLVIDPDGSGGTAAFDPANLREDGTDLAVGRIYRLSWQGSPGETYQLQLDDATTLVRLLVVELRGGVAVAGLRQSSSSSSGLSSVSTTGDALSGAGTAGSPLAVAADLENLVDTATVSASGHVTLTGRQQAIDYGGGIATLSSLVSISVAAGQASTRTITLSNDATGSGAISVDTAGLSASESRHVLVVITDSGGPHDLEFPGDWKWTNADGAPTTTVASGVHFLWLQSWGATDSTVMATWIEAQ